VHLFNIFCVIFSYVCHGSHVASLIGDDVLVLLLCLGHVSDNARMCHGQYASKPLID
jgi:hypothetical protein